MTTRSGRSLRLGAEDALIEELECAHQGTHVVDIVSSDQGSPPPDHRLEDARHHEVVVQVHHPADASLSSSTPVHVRAQQHPYNVELGGGHPRPPLQAASPAMPPPAAGSTTASQLQPPVDAISSPVLQGHHEAAQGTGGAGRGLFIPPPHAAPQAAALPPTGSIIESSLGDGSRDQLDQLRYDPTGTGSRDNLVTEQLGAIDQRGRASLPPLPQLGLLTVATATTTTHGSAASLPGRVVESTYLPTNNAAATLSSVNSYATAQTGGMGWAIYPSPQPPVPPQPVPPQHVPLFQHIETTRRPVLPSLLHRIGPQSDPARFIATSPPVAPLQAPASPMYARMEAAGAGNSMPAGGPAFLTRTARNPSTQEAAQGLHQPLPYNYNTAHNSQVGQQIYAQNRYCSESPLAHSLSDGGVGGQNYIQATSTPMCRKVGYLNTFRSLSRAFVRHSFVRHIKHQSLHANNKDDLANYLVRPTMLRAQKRTHKEIPPPPIHLG